MTSCSLRISAKPNLEQSLSVLILSLKLFLEREDEFRISSESDSAEEKLSSDIAAINNFRGTKLENNRWTTHIVSDFKKLYIS